MCSQVHKLILTQYTLIWNYSVVIISFKDEATGDLFHGMRTKKVLRIPHTIWAVAQRKLDMLNTAHDLIDLKVPPNNKLEALKGSLKGFHSVRINDQFRVLFRWTNGNAAEVQVTDYH